MTAAIEGLINLFDFEAKAKEVLPKDVWDFVDSGDFDEITVRRNRAALDAVALRPRFLIDIGTLETRDTSTTVLGQKISFPVMLAPCASQGRCHEDGEKASAVGATSQGTIYVINSNSRYSLEEVMQAASGPLWFQLYHQHTDQTIDLVQRAEAAGYSAICLTVDVPFATRKERDIRNQFRPGGTSAGATGAPRPAVWAPPITWADLAWLRSLTSLPLVVKGIRTAEDARLCVEHGVDGVYVSNHGGRQIDGTLSAIETLPEMVDAVGDRAEVYFDSGVRRGADVLRALALGARAVLIGRPFLWGLAVDGEAGVSKVVDLLRQEFDRAMGSCGVRSVAEISRSLVALPGESGWLSGWPVPYR